MRLSLRRRMHTLAASWALRGCLGLLFVYLVLGWVFARETRAVGLFDPDGHPHYAVVALGVAYLLTRIAVRFLLPALVAFVVADRAVRALRDLRAIKAGRG